MPDENKANWQIMSVFT